MDYGFECIKKLPDGWTKTILEDICKITMGQSPPSSTYNTTKIGLPFYQGKSEFKEIYPAPKIWCSISKKIAEKGDILLSVRAPVGPTNICPEKSCIGRGLASIRYLGDKNSIFVFYLFRAIESKLSQLGTGSTFQAISKSDVVNIPILLPPLPEQHRIVEKIEELFTKLDVSIAELKKAKAQIKRYRQSVLKHAFEGKMTNDIFGDELPKGWQLFNLGKITSKKTIKALPNDYPDAKFIGMDCIEPHTLIPSFLHNFSEFKSAGNYFEIGNVLYGRMRPYLNKVYKAEFNGTCSGEFIVLQCNQELEPSYLAYNLHSKEFVDFANRKTTGDRPRISYDEISEYSIRIPLKVEQQKIVSLIERHFSVADETEKIIDQSLKQAERLRQSILKDAFSGKLVPQDPNDEPAEKLLERIKEEKLKLGKSKK